ncbi:MAG: hypothetical protein IIB57_03185 [Planctomycetes bacterium]|nr:hypothetical protein [Planctomycetota bacterium]
MATDPKKNDEIKDEELEAVSGGTGGDNVDEQPDDGTHGDKTLPKSGKGGMMEA